jgi:REP element-mobilizing transposase RayT
MEHCRTRTLDWTRLARRFVRVCWWHHEEEECQIDLRRRNDDHIHLFASLPSTITIADFVGVVKSNSSRWVHRSFPKRRAFAWQEGYGAFSVSKSEEDKVIRYILNQEHHHAKRNFKDEFLEFLHKYKIEYDERYLWD